MRAILRVITAVLGLCLPVCGATIVVDINGTGDFTAIQPALDAAADGDEVLVKPGEYVVTEPIDFNRLHNSEDPANPPMKDLVLRSEAGAEETTIRMAEEPADPERASVVIFENGESEESVLEGFTITGGKGTVGPALQADVGETEPRGGGILITDGSAPRINSCRIVDNSAFTDCGHLSCGGGDGGGVCCLDSTLVLTQCQIEGNLAGAGGGIACHSATTVNLLECRITGNEAWGVFEEEAGRFRGYGGGVYCVASTVTLSTCQVQENIATNGGGLCLREAEATLEDCNFTSNQSDYEGGGLCLLHESSATVRQSAMLKNVASAGGAIHCAVGVSPSFEDCEISHNLAVGFCDSEIGCDGGRGGAVHCGRGASPSFTGCTLCGNSAIGFCDFSFGEEEGCFAGEGGAVYCDRESSPILRECLLSANTAGDGGGVYCSEEASPAFEWCTISGNAQMGVSCLGASPLFRSSIVWGNSGGALRFDETSSLQLAYCCIEGPDPAAWAGEGNINVDPQFCGWEWSSEVWVNPEHPSPGQGSEEDPFSDVQELLCQYRLSLAPDSPCRGTGEEGSDMGASTEACNAAGAESLLVHLAAGEYDLPYVNLSHDVSLVGAGMDQTTLLGTVWGLRTGAYLEGLAVRQGKHGGVVISAREAPELRACDLSRNKRPGLVCNEQSSPRLVDCTMSENERCGALCLDLSTPTFSRCTISGNTEGARWEVGEGVDCQGGAMATLQDCLLSGNRGSGISLSSSSATLGSCTIVGNRAEEAAGAVQLGPDSSMAIINSIVWGHDVSIQLEEGAEIQVVYSCVENEAPWPGLGNTNLDPLFTDPDGGDDNWETWEDNDLHLVGDSPCIDTGASSQASELDLDRKPRVCGSGVDMGAYESGNCGSLPSFIRGDANADDKVDISDSIFTLMYLFQADVETLPCLKTGDADDDGDVDITDAIYGLNFQWLGGDPIPAPYPLCGLDPTADDLTCDSFEPCE